MASYLYSTTAYGNITITETTDNDLRIAGFRYYLPVTNNNTASAEMRCPHFATIREAKHYIDETTFSGSATYATS